MKCRVHNTVFHSPEENNKIELIGLMAVCKEHIICDRSVDFSLSERNKKAKGYISL